MTRDGNDGRALRIRAMGAGLLAPLLLAGCLGFGGDEPISGADEYVALDHSVPRGVEALLPPGVRPFDVRERDLCYAYLSDGKLVPVTRADGTQYCLK